MLAVVDANIVFSALISKGKPFRVFMSNKALNYYEFIAPEYLLSEMDENHKIADIHRLSCGIRRHDA